MSVRQALDSLAPDERRALLHAFEEGFHLAYPAGPRLVVGVHPDSSCVVLHQEGFWYIGEARKSD